MKCLLALIALLFALTLADYPLYIDELGDLVSDADERQLDMLDDDEFTPRSQLKMQFDEILNRQSPAVQTAYRAIVAREEAERMSKEMRKSQKYQARGLDSIYQQVLSIEGDLSLSENQVKQQTRDLKRQLN